MDLKVERDHVLDASERNKSTTRTLLHGATNDLTFVFIYLYGLGILFCFCIFLCRFKKHMKIAFFRVCKIDNYYALKLGLLNLYSSMRT